MRLHALSLLPLLAALLLVVAPASGDPGTQKQQVDAKIDHLEDQISRAESVSGTLTSEISAATAVIRSVEDDVSAEEARLDVLEAELAGTQAELDRLTELLADQTSRLERLRGEHAAAVRRLESRVREIYLEDTPDALSFVFESASFSDLLDSVEFLNSIGRQDERIAARVGRAKAELAQTRAATVRTRTGVSEAARMIAARTAEQRGIRDRLVASRDALAAARSDKRSTLAGIREDRAEFIAEVEALQQRECGACGQDPQRADRLRRLDRLGRLLERPDLARPRRR